MHSTYVESCGVRQDRYDKWLTCGERTGFVFKERWVWATKIEAYENYQMIWELGCIELPEGERVRLYSTLYLGNGARDSIRRKTFLGSMTPSRMIIRWWYKLDISSYGHSYHHSILYAARIPSFSLYGTQSWGGLTNRCGMKSVSYLIT